MKYRSGFVSNSSSSSFIVAFPNDIQYDEHSIHMLLFNTNKNIDVFHKYHGTYKSYDIVDIICKDIVKQDGKTKKLIDDFFAYRVECDEELYNNAHQEIDDLERKYNALMLDNKDNVKSLRSELRKARKNVWKKVDDILIQRGRLLSASFINDNINAKLFVFTYSDEDGCNIYGFLRNYNVFKNLNHLTNN